MQAIVTAIYPAAGENNDVPCIVFRDVSFDAAEKAFAQVIVEHFRGRALFRHGAYAAWGVADPTGRPTLRIASINSFGRPQSELKKIVVTLTAIAAIAHTG